MNTFFIKVVWHAKFDKIGGGHWNSWLRSISFNPKVNSVSSSSIVQHADTHSQHSTHLVHRKGTTRNTLAKGKWKKVVCRYICKAIHKRSYFYLIWRLKLFDMENKYCFHPNFWKTIQISSVADPPHFDANPLQKIRIWTNSNFFSTFFSVKGIKLVTMFFFVIYELLFTYLFFGFFLCGFIKIFFCYPDPDQRFLKWIRIRPNDTDPTGSGPDQKHCK